MNDLRSLGASLAGLLDVASRTFMATFFVVFGAGVLLAGASYYFLRDHPLYGSLAVVAVLIESLVVGVGFGGKRALVVALAHGIRTLGLGRRAVRMIFAVLQSG